MVKIDLFYYVNDHQNTQYYTKYTNKNSEMLDNKSYDFVYVYPLYNNDFIEVGTLKIITNGTYINNIVYYNYEFIIYINDSNNVISSSYSFIGISNSEYLPPHIPINMTINYCSGNIYNKSGTVILLPFDNKQKSRMLTIELQ